MDKKKVLIIKHGSIGDIFMSFRTVKAIYSIYKNITICSTNNGLKIFELLDFKFDKIADSRSKNLFTNIYIIFKIISSDFDLVIDLQNSKRTSIYLLLLKIFSKTITNGTSKFATHTYKKENFNEHAIQGLINQVKLLDINVENYRYYNTNRSILRQVVIVPGSSKKGLYKRWPIKNYLTLISFLSSKNIKSIIIGGQDEEDIKNKFPNDNLIINLIGKSPWLEVKKFAQQSIFAISNDTSAMHFISELNIPVIALMNDNRYSIRNYPLSKNSVLIKSKNITDISIEKVLDEVKKFI